MDTLRIVDLTEIDAKEYIKKTKIIQNDICYLLKSTYYWKAIVNHNCIIEKLNRKCNLDNALYCAIEHFLRLNKIQVFLSLWKLLYDNSKPETYTLNKHIDFVSKLYHKYNIKTDRIKKISHNEFREELRFVRHKFLAHSEYTQDELKKINLPEYDSLIAEIVSKYNEILLSESDVVNEENREFIPFSDELISNLIINCNEGIATMLHFKWS